MNIFLYGMDNVGFLQTSGLVDYHHGWLQFSEKEKMYWTIMSYLYYPIYIFLFIIPFVKHLDKSSKKQKEQDAQKEQK